MDVLEDTVSPVILIDDGAEDLQENLFKIGRDKLAKTWPHPHQTGSRITAFLYALSIGHIEAVQILLMILPQDYVTLQWSQWSESSEVSFYSNLLKRMEDVIADAKSHLTVGNDWFFDEFSWLVLPRFWLKQLWTLVGCSDTLIHTMDHPRSICHFRHWSVDAVEFDFPSQQWPIFYSIDVNGTNGGSLEGEFRSTIDLQGTDKQALLGFTSPVTFLTRSYTFAENHLQKQWHQWRALTCQDRIYFSSMMRTLLLSEAGYQYNTSLEHVWSKWWFSAFGDDAELKFRYCWDSCNHIDDYIKVLTESYNTISETVYYPGVSYNPNAEEFVKRLRSCSTRQMQQCLNVSSPFRQTVNWYARYRSEWEDDVFVMPHRSEDESLSETISRMSN